MPGKIRCRRVSNEPKVNIFKPQGIPYYELEEVTLKVEELEALRLKDAMGLEQEECAQHMQVSRPTFQRILNEAHYKLATALINGNAIRIEGGNYCLGKGFCRRYGRYLTDMETCALQQDNKKGSENMSNKIAVCSTGSNPSSAVDGRFGRCNCFMVWNQASKQYDSLANNAVESAHGAGTGAVQSLIQNNVKAVITQRVGPKAFAVLQQAGIKIFNSSSVKTVEEAVQSYESGQLQEILAPNN